MISAPISVSVKWEKSVLLHNVVLNKVCQALSISHMEVPNISSSYFKEVDGLEKR